MPGKTLPDDRVKALVESGKTDTEIRNILESEDGIKVTRQAISAWRARRNVGSPPAEQLASIPWKLRPEHLMSEPARAIRYRARLDAGLHVPPEDLARVQRVEQRLAEVGGVLTYDRNTPSGWAIVPRRQGVDKGIIREPEI